MQLRGPTLHGCMASLVSVSKPVLGSQRSGIKESGSLKLEAEWFTAHCGTLTRV